MNLDVVMLARKNPLRARMTVAALDGQGEDYEGWFVDNSDDGLFRSEVRHWGRRWHYLAQGRNVPYAEACNWAARQGFQPWLLFLNDDAVLHQGALAAMADHAAAGDAFVGPVQYARDGTVFQAGHRFDGHGWPWDHHRMDRVPGCFETEALAGSVLLAARRAFADIGGFDERYVWSMDDIDLSCRAREAGYRLRVCAVAGATHEQMGTRGPETRPYEQAGLLLAHRTWNARALYLPPPDRFYRRHEDGVTAGYHG